MTFKLSGVVSLACVLAIAACGDDAKDAKASEKRRANVDAGDIHTKDAEADVVLLP
jgi:hypothetical protein